MVKVGEHFYKNERMWQIINDYPAAAQIAACCPEVERNRPMLFDYGETDGWYTVVTKSHLFQAVHHIFARSVEYAVYRVQNEHRGLGGSDVAIAVFPGRHTALQWAGPYGDSMELTRNGGNSDGEVEAGQRVGEGPAQGSGESA